LGCTVGQRTEWLLHMQLKALLYHGLAQKRQAVVAISKMNAGEVSWAPRLSPEAVVRVRLTPLHYVYSAALGSSKSRGSRP